MAKGLFVAQVLLCVRVLGAPCVAHYVLKLRSVVLRLQVGFLMMEWCVCLSLSVSLSVYVSLCLCLSLRLSLSLARALSLSLSLA